MPDTSIAERLALLPTLGNAALNELWKELFGTIKSPLLRRELTIPLLAYRMQEQTFGPLSTDSRALLRQIARSLEVRSRAGIVRTPGIKPGTRLVRQWQNQVHIVTVASRGFEYQGARYQSLSEIARLITGTRWSGPLFFGINSKQHSPSLEAH